jgi:hypothetical protein
MMRAQDETKAPPSPNKVPQKNRTSGTFCTHMPSKASRTRALVEQINETTLSHPMQVTMDKSATTAKRITA